MASKTNEGKNEDREGNRVIPDDVLTPIGITYGQARKAYKQVKDYFKEPPIPAEQHREKARKLRTKSERYDRERRNQ